MRRRGCLLLSWLAIVLIAVAPAGLGAPAPVSAAPASSPHHAASEEMALPPPGAHAAAHAAHAPGWQAHGSAGMAAGAAQPDHHEGTSSCCLVGCVVAALLEEGSELPLPGALAPPLKAPTPFVGRATSPPHRPPRLHA